MVYALYLCLPVAQLTLSPLEHPIREPLPVLWLLWGTACLGQALLDSMCSGGQSLIALSIPVPLPDHRFVTELVGASQVCL